MAHSANTSRRSLGPVCENHRPFLPPAAKPVKRVFLISYLERGPQLPLSLRQVDPLIRELTEYRDFIQSKTQENEP